MSKFKVLPILFVLGLGNVHAAYNSSEAAKALKSCLDSQVKTLKKLGKDFDSAIDQDQEKLGDVSQRIAKRSKTRNFLSATFSNVLEVDHDLDPEDFITAKAKEKAYIRRESKFSALSDDTLALIESLENDGQELSSYQQILEQDSDYQDQVKLEEFVKKTQKRDKAFEGIVRRSIELKLDLDLKALDVGTAKSCTLLAISLHDASEKVDLGPLENEEN